jgi:hypothetical protein
LSDPNGHADSNPGDDDADDDGDPDFLDVYPGIPDKLIRDPTPGGPIIIGRRGAAGGQPLANQLNKLKSPGAAASKNANQLMSKKTPNPGGKLGDQQTKKRTDEVVKQIENRGNIAVREDKFEFYGGFKIRRYSDVSEYEVGPNGQLRLKAIHQIGKYTKSGVPVSRERNAISDISRSERARGANIFFHDKFSNRHSNYGDGRNSKPGSCNWNGCR